MYYILYYTEMVPLWVWTCLFGYIWYCLFWRPFDNYKDISANGFEDVQKSNRGNKYKQNAVNELIRQRKVGDLPPGIPNGWFVILESADLPSNGTAKDLYILGKNLVVWRGESGKAYVADAYCPHLGTHLGVGGKVLGECVQCPFHGWSFRGEDGALTNIPYSENVPKNTKIKMWRTMELNDCIYFWYHAEGEEPTWFPEPIPEIQSGEFRYRGRMEYKVSCHLQEIQENGADSAHFKGIHTPFIMCGNDPQTSFFKWDFIKHNFSATWSKPREDQEKHITNMVINHELCLFNRFKVLKATFNGNQVGPGMIVLHGETTLGRGIAYHIFTPYETLCHKAILRVYTSSSFIHPFGKLFVLFEAIMLERDMRIFNRKMFVKNPLLTKEEASISQYRRWFSQFYTENSPRLQTRDPENGILDF